MPKIVEITEEQYNALLSIGAPVGWDTAPYCATEPYTEWVWEEIHMSFEWLPTDTYYEIKFFTLVDSD